MNWPIHRFTQAGAGAGEHGSRAGHIAKGRKSCQESIPVWLLDFDRRETGLGCVGRGRMDKQSLAGKGPSWNRKADAQKRFPVLAICGKFG